MKKWLPVLACSLLVLSACGGGDDTSAKPADDDRDSIVNTIDNCPSVPNTNQLDTDGDGIGDVCDSEDGKQLALNIIVEYAKTKGKSVAPSVQDYASAGVLGVTVAKLAEINQLVSSSEESDVDTQGEINQLLKDNGIVIPPPIADDDNDGVKDSIDNCPSHPNPDQKDTDKDGSGNVCDLDNDDDGILNKVDNCPLHSNRDQKDTDKNGVGDVCEGLDTGEDRDNDGISDNLDNCPLDPNKDQSDKDKDGIGDVCDTEEDKDKDNDGISDDLDNCPLDPNKDQSDKDKDGIGDVCDTDDNRDNDNDGIANELDNCPLHSNADQSDADGDGIGDVCDSSDTDGDGVIDKFDDFPSDKTKVASVTNAYRLLNQATFGATESEIDNIVTIGTATWVDQQLAKPSAYDSANDNFKTHLERTAEIAETIEPLVGWFDENGIFGPGGPQYNLKHYQASAWYENTLGHPTNVKHGSDQLRQRVAYSLSQLFVASANDTRLSSRGESLAYFYDLLAKNSFGDFRTLLGEVARSATMGVYLTYQGNKKTNLDKSTRPDENFAREVIQLFTVGLYELNIDGSPNRDGNANTYPDAGTGKVPTYTQDDIVELAKVMTGWDLKGNSRFGNTNVRIGEYAAQMEFSPEYHEDEVAEGGDGLVTVLGKTFALNSGADGSGMDVALDVLFNHPNTAPFVSKHFITNLVTSNPSSGYVARVAKVFNNNGSGVRGDLKATLRAVLMDVEARDTKNQNKNFGKVKEPFLVFTQLLRSFNVSPMDGWKGPASTQYGGTSTTVNGIYNYTSPQLAFGQGALRSQSVFNFYMPDYAPRDSYFTDNNMVSPETQIQTDGQILVVHNLIASYVRRYEKNRITKIDKKTITEFAASKRIYSKHLMMINYDRELALFEQALDGNTNGDFNNMTSTVARVRAVEALLIHLDKVMLGNTMSDEFKRILGNHLATSSSFSTRDKFAGAHHLISDAVRFIATSNAYLVNK